MFNKKIYSFFVGILFLSLFVVNFASAYRYGFVGSIDSLVYQAQPVLQFFFGGYDYTGYALFERILLFILILSLVFVSLKNVPLFKGDEQKKIRGIIAVIVSLLSIRYIDFMWLNTIFVSYQILGIALTSLLPFIIYFFFLMGVAPPQKGYSGIRKIGWALFGCVYLGLYITSDVQSYSQVYLWTALVAFLFFLLDRSIQRYYISELLKQGNRDRLLDHKLKLEKELKDLEAAGALNEANSPYYPRYKEKIHELNNLNKLLT